jgi:hypothetical protein
MDFWWRCLWLIVSTGVASVLEKVKTKYRTYITYGIVFVLLCTLAAAELINKYTYESDETGTLRDAEQIVDYFIENLQPNDYIFFQCPSSLPSYYYYYIRTGKTISYTCILNDLEEKKNCIFSQKQITKK